MKLNWQLQFLYTDIRSAVESFTALGGDGHVMNCVLHYRHAATSRAEWGGGRTAASCLKKKWWRREVSPIHPSLTQTKSSTPLFLFAHIKHATAWEPITAQQSLTTYNRLIGCLAMATRPSGLSLREEDWPSADRQLTESQGRRSNLHSMGHLG